MAKPLSFNKINTVHSLILILISFRGDNVEDAFLDTAKKIYQNIQDGRYVLSLQSSELILSMCHATHV